MKSVYENQVLKIFNLMFFIYSTYEKKKFDLDVVLFFLLKMYIL